MSWPPIPLHTPLGELVGMHVAAKGTGVLDKPTLVLLSVTRRWGERVKVMCMDVGLRTNPPPQAYHQYVPAEATLEEVLSGLGQLRASAAGRVPGIRWPGNTKQLPGWVIPSLFAISGLMTATGFAFGSDRLLMLVPGVLAGTVIFALTTMPGSLASMPPQVKADGRELLATEVSSRLITELPGPSPQQRVAQLKASYAQLLGDICYRIENSALFDTAVAETQRFQLALLAWDPGSPEAEQLALELEESFGAAKARAEALGLAHLPQTAEPTARRALKAAQLALKTSSLPEREAASQQAAQLLRSLALYWLPSVDPKAPSLIGERQVIEPVALDSEAEISDDH